MTEKKVNEAKKEASNVHWSKIQTINTLILMFRLSWEEIKKRGLQIFFFEKWGQNVIQNR